MDFSAEIQMAFKLEEGSVFLFQEESFNSEKPHFFAVLNLKPKDDELLLLVCAVTLSINSWERTANMPDETKVHVFPEEYSNFTVPTIFDCNFPIEKPKSLLVEKLREGKLKFLGPVNGELLSKLRAAVLLSPMVTESTKQIINNS